jgi:hypothetical protein
MKKRVLVLGVVVLVLLTSLQPAAVGAQGPNTYTSIIVSDVVSGAPVVGSTFVTDVKISVTNNAAPNLGVMGAELWLPFDPAVVSVVDHDGNPANGTQVELTNDFFDGSLAIGANEVIVGAMPATAPADCGAAGACVHVAVSHTGGSGAIQNKIGRVARITWAALATGSPAISIAVVAPGVPPGSVLSTASGGTIDINSTSVPTITVIDAGQINGKVTRQGAQAGHANTNVVALAVGNGVAATDVTGASGSFALVVPVGSTYTINASYPGYLQAQKSSVYVVGATVGIGSTTLKGGDVNADNCINILDIVSIISKFGTTGLPATDPEDINDDGTINILDLTIAAGNFTRCGPTTW